MKRREGELDAVHALYERGILTQADRGDDEPEREPEGDSHEDVEPDAPAAPEGEEAPEDGEQEPTAGGDLGMKRLLAWCEDECARSEERMVGFDPTTASREVVAFEHGTHRHAARVRAVVLAALRGESMSAAAAAAERDWKMPPTGPRNTK